MRESFSKKGVRRRALMSYSNQCPNARGSSMRCGAIVQLCVIGIRARTELRAITSIGTGWGRLPLARRHHLTVLLCPGKHIILLTIPGSATSALYRLALSRLRTLIGILWLIQQQEA